MCVRGGDHHKEDLLIPPGFPVCFSLVYLGVVHMFARVSLVGVQWDGAWDRKSNRERCSRRTND